MKVLLIDADFRKPTQRKVFGLEDTIGLAECLSDDAVKWQNCVIPSIAKNLDLLPAGHAKGHAAELLQRESAERILAEACSEYDIVIIDSAPVNRVVDTVLLARMANVVALVTMPGQTTMPSAHRALRRLEGTNLIGYIANNVTSATQRYYSEYGSYGYNRYYRDRYQSHYHGYGDTDS